MKNPLYNSRHVKEYLLFGLLAALGYMVFVVLFLVNNRFGNFYLMYIGNAVFMAVIGYYAYQLIERPYDSRRAVTMLIAGNLTVLTGILLSCIFIWIAMFIFSPRLFTTVPVNIIVKEAPATVRPHTPAELSFMLMLNAIMGNFGMGAFISLIMAYAGKKNQTEDRPAELNTHTPPVTPIPQEKKHSR